MPAEKPTLICLAPIRNEAWILERYLQCASLWADHIIVADQLSNDGSREIVCRFPKAILIENNSPAYDEGARQKLLLDAARTIPGRRVLFALDADEMLSANYASSQEWEKVCSAPPGTVVRMEWANLLPNFRQCWVPPHSIPYGFADDGSEHTGQKIHSTRLPVPEGAPVIELKEIKLLHYQYTDWARMLSKQRWYQGWERINHPDKRAITIYRQYHHMEGWPEENMHSVQEDWLAGYEKAGIDMRSVASAPFYRWDPEMLELMRKHGTGFFSKLGIWDIDWQDVAVKAGMEPKPGEFADPRTPIEKRVHKWLAATQARSLDPKIRTIQRALRLLGW